MLYQNPYTEQQARLMSLGKLSMESVLQINGVIKPVVVDSKEADTVGSTVTNTGPTEPALIEPTEPLSRPASPLDMDDLFKSLKDLHRTSSIPSTDYLTATEDEYATAEGSLIDEDESDDEFAHESEQEKNRLLNQRHGRLGGLSHRSELNYKSNNELNRALERTFNLFKK